MTADAKEKLKALQLTIDKLEKTYGKGAVMKLSDEKIMDVPAISTGSLGLDIALGIGGIPRGRVTEIYGPESSGKTTLTMHCIAQAQKKGGLAAFIDAEHAFDKTYAEKLGIDTENLLISQPDNGEQALEIAALLGAKQLIDTNSEVLAIQLKEIIKEHRALIINRMVGELPVYLDYKFNFKTDNDSLIKIKDSLLSLKNS